MSKEFRLNCWVFGDDPDNVFTAKVKSEETVGDLKDVIMSKNPHFGSIPAHTLALWKVDFPIDLTLRQYLDDLNLVDEERLLPLELSEVFTDHPLRKRLHIVVRLPPTATEQRLTHGLHVVPEPKLELLCHVEGEKAKFIFLVRIKSSENVHDLKKAIQRERKDLFDEISAVKLVLWKTSIPMDDSFDQAILDANFTDEESLGPVPLSKVFPVPPPPEHIHIVVKVDDLYILRDIRVRKYRRLPSGARSDLGDPAKFCDYQEKLNAFHFERPLQASHDIPPTLLHPIFGEFLDDCESHVPNREDNMLAFDLRHDMCQIFGPESDRLSELVRILRKHGIEPPRLETDSDGASYRTDAHVQMNGFRFVIIESKNERGSEGSEPLFKAIWHYQRSVGGDDGYLCQSQSIRNLLFLAFYCPHIGFAGAAYTDRPHVQVLSTPFPLFCHRTDTKSQLTVARHVGALKNAIAKLRRYYEVDLPSPSISQRNLNALYPYPSEFISFRDRFKSTRCFTYKSQFEGKLVFKATLANGRLICVKFTQKYSREAHEECVKLQCAPVLHDFKVLPGGWFMIVMDYLDYDRYHFPQDSDLSDELYKAMKNSLVKLHEAGFVHGDIRDINTMVKNDEPSRFMLLDFDWSGKIGEIRYPPNVNTAQKLQRPDGAIDGKPVLAEHDRKMLKVMFPTSDKRRKIR